MSKLGLGLTWIVNSLVLGGYMRGFNVLVGCFLTTAIVTSWANQCHLKYGGYRSNQSSFDGPTECYNVDQDALKVNGPLSIEHSKVKRLTVDGPATLRHSDIHTLTINGYLQAYHSHIQHIQAHAKLKLHNSTVGNIDEGGSSWRHYKVYLYKGTQVTGHIHFKHDNGIIYKASNAHIKGSVSGAEVKPMSQS